MLMRIGDPATGIPAMQARARIGSAAAVGRSEGPLKRALITGVTGRVLVAEMVREDFKGAQRDSLVRSHGFQTMDRHE